MPYIDIEKRREYARKYAQEHREELYARTKKWREEHPEHNKALKRNRHRKYIVVVNGKENIVPNKPSRPDDICELCGRKVWRLHYHHWDNEHLEWGLWVCGFCHHGVEMFESGLIEKYLVARRNYGSN